jgi:Mrp family chromosome partitioning ATPase
MTAVPRNLRTRVYADTRTPVLTVAVLQQKGGCGKTTLAINLAAAAHLDGRRTLVVDMDRQSFENQPPHLEIQPWVL